MSIPTNPRSHRFSNLVQKRLYLQEHATYRLYIYTPPFKLHSEQHTDLTSSIEIQTNFYYFPPWKLHPPPSATTSTKPWLARHHGEKKPSSSVTSFSRWISAYSLRTTPTDSGFFPMWPCRHCRFQTPLIMEEQTPTLVEIMCIAVVLRGAIWGRAAATISIITRLLITLLGITGYVMYDIICESVLYFFI